MNINKHFLMITMLVLLVVQLSSAAAAAELGDRVLKVGSTGEDVLALQAKLNAVGFQLDREDGVYGPATEQAINDLQKENNLPADGVAGEDTINVILNKQTVSASRSNSDGPSRYKKVLDIVATAYAPGPHDNGKWGSLTHIGTQVRPGIIAVDPNIIPLGSKVYIQYPDGHGAYAVAEDTGGAIKGNRIDIAMWSIGEANNFGIQKVKLYVVN